MSVVSEMPQAAARTGMIRNPRLPSDYPARRAVPALAATARSVLAETACPDVVPPQGLRGLLRETRLSDVRRLRNTARGRRLQERPADLLAACAESRRGVSLPVVGSPIKGSVQP
jgi:hypothetical protein